MRSPARATKITQVIQTARKAKGLTQGEVAKLIGVTGQHYNRFENGTVKPTPEVLQKLRDALGIEMSNEEILRSLLEPEQEPNDLEAKVLKAWRLRDTNTLIRLIGQHCM